MFDRHHPANPLTAATAALRTGSVSLLKEGLIRFLRACDPVHDHRDVMVGLAPLHDCARRIGADPDALFQAAAHEVGGEAAEIASTFGRRSDITPRAFDYHLETSSAGPEYHWGSAPSVADKQQSS